MFEKAKLKWRSQTTTDRLYTLTIVFAYTGYASTFFFRGNFLFFGIALTISSSLFVIGFFRWIWAWLGDKWKTKLGKFIISALSAAIWFLAIILSRIFVAKALDLPPQDFETTVYIVAFWLYPALCFLLLSVTMLIISLMFTTRIFLRHSLHHHRQPNFPYSVYFPSESLSTMDYFNPDKDSHVH